MPLYIYELLQIYFKIPWTHMPQTVRSHSLKRSVFCFSDPSLRTVKVCSMNMLSDRWCLLETMKRQVKKDPYICVCVCIVYTQGNNRDTHVLEHVGKMYCRMNVDSQGRFFSISAFIKCRRNKRKAMQQQQKLFA